MRLPRLLALVCCTCCMVQQSSPFELPQLDNIAETFGNLLRKVRSVDTDAASEQVTSDEGDRVQSRSKRQSTNIGDESPYPYEIRSSSLPLRGSKVNTRYMPTIGNGYLGATIYDDALFLDGVYSGTGSESHRASIPALLMGRISIINDEIDRRASRKYTLNALEGYFMESIDCEFGIVHHKIYIHQKYIRLFVVDTYAKLKRGAYGGMVLNVKYPSLNSSRDMTFTNPVAYQGGSLQAAFTTKSAEAGENTKTVNVFYSSPLEQLAVSGTHDEVNYTQVMAVDKQTSEARFERVVDRSVAPEANFFSYA